MFSSWHTSEVSATNCLLFFLSLTHETLNLLFCPSVEPLHSTPLSTRRYSPLARAQRRRLWFLSLKNPTQANHRGKPPHPHGSYSGRRSNCLRPGRPQRTSTSHCIESFGGFARPKTLLPSLQSQEKPSHHNQRPPSP